MKTRYTRLYGDLPPLLALEEEEELFRRKMAGDEEARQRLIEGNMRIVLFMVKRAACSKEDLEEMASEGMLALVRCVDGFDPSAGVRFSSYASRAAQNAIRMIWRKRSMRRDMCSLESPVATRRDGAVVRVADSIAGDNDFEEAAMVADDYRQLREAIAHLPERNQQFLFEHYGFDGRTPKTQIELQDVFHINQSVISRLKTRTLKKLRLLLVKGYQ